MLDIESRERAAMRATRNEFSAAMETKKFLTGGYGNKEVTFAFPSEKDAKRFMERIQHWVKIFTQPLNEKSEQD